MYKVLSRRQHIEDIVWWCTEVEECRLYIKYKVWEIGQSPEERLRMSERYVKPWFCVLFRKSCLLYNVLEVSLLEVVVNNGCVFCRQDRDVIPGQMLSLRLVIWILIWIVFVHTYGYSIYMRKL